MQPKEVKCVRSNSKKEDDLHNGYYQTMQTNKTVVENAFSSYLESVRLWCIEDERSKQQITCSSPPGPKEWLSAKEWAELLGVKPNLLNSRLYSIRSLIPKEFIELDRYRKKYPLYKAKELTAWMDVNFPGMLKPQRKRGA